MITVSVHRGLGQHVYYLTSEARNSAISLAIISNPLGFLASAWPNISVAISLNRILIPLPWQVAILYGIPILQCTVALVCSILTYIQCTPLAGRWDPTLPHKCLPGNAILGLIYFNGGKWSL